MFKVGDEVYIKFRVKSVATIPQTTCYYHVQNIKNGWEAWVGDSEALPTKTPDIEWQPVPADRRFPEDGDYLIAWPDGDIRHFTNRVGGLPIEYLNATHIAKVNFDRPSKRQVTATIICDPETLGKIKALGVEVK